MPSWFVERSRAKLHISLNGGADYSITYFNSVRVADFVLLESRLEIASSVDELDTIYVRMSGNISELNLNTLVCSLTIRTQPNH